MYMAFDRTFAASQGINTRIASYILSIVVAITIVMAIRIMGIVLLLSLFTIPAVAANTLTKSYPRITLWAAIIATIGAVGGLVASYNWEVPPGTCIIFILTVVLIAAKLLSLHLKTRLNAH
jgi:zinc transport system permease protein